MFKDDTFKAEERSYTCPLSKDCYINSIHMPPVYNGYELMFHLVSEHELSKEKSFVDERNRLSKEMPKNMLIMAPIKVLDAAMLALMFGQNTLMEYIIKKHAKEMSVIKNAT